ncbi:hypothetical protein BC936DRAFT_146020 [Jimgerdemannia flammicorona]|uniref:Uncharacterized protein n=1 Tax=Jimgerdemannia flammicorona TaxID=994334 RepID=A0A433D8P5_9FUNG|nr:hypothetical protein BC936DRAFT_146020 [Jimgerdemannia flammicorona]
MSPALTGALRESARGCVGIVSSPGDQAAEGVYGDQRYSRGGLVPDKLLNPRPTPLTSPSMARPTSSWFSEASSERRSEPTPTISSPPTTSSATVACMGHVS